MFLSAVVCLPIMASWAISRPIAIPIAGARPQIGSFDRTVKVAAQDREAVFKVRLPAGPSIMKSWFLDKAGQELLGAYYAYVYRTGAPKAGYAAGLE